jgi:hypothetical protein
VRGHQTTQAILEALPQEAAGSRAVQTRGDIRQELLEPPATISPATPRSARPDSSMFAHRVPSRCYAFAAGDYKRDASISGPDSP